MFTPRKMENIGKLMAKYSFKGSGKREKWGAGKESNVTIWCRTVAIDVYLQFEHAVLE
jgi:hypothetical protein